MDSVDSVQVQYEWQTYKLYIYSSRQFASFKNCCETTIAYVNLLKLTVGMELPNYTSGQVYTD